MEYIKTIYLKDDKLFILDQRLLPNEEKYIELKDEKDVYNAIKNLAIRGAPAIGICASYGVYISLLKYNYKNFTEFKTKSKEVINFIGSSRPTAYNLFYCLKRIENIINSTNEINEAINLIKSEAIKIHNEDLEKSEKIGENGLLILPNNPRIISHCNAGGLATGGGGTSLSIIYKAKEKNKNIFVYVDETRPLLQGSRLTAWELKKQNIPYQVITDNTAAFLMKMGFVDLILVGADRIAKNGDFANKIGTYSLAVNAHYHGIPFYTAAPISTFDFNIENGNQIPIEQRDKFEVIKFSDSIVAPIDSDVYNPAFDITPHNLITGIITEFGIIYPPFYENISNLIEKVWIK